MGNQLCFKCLKVKGDYEVCPYCGRPESTKPKHPFHLTPGTMLHGRYNIGRSTGSDDFAITYKAYDTACKRLVAVREFYPREYANRKNGETDVSIGTGREREYFQQKGAFIEEAQKTRSLFEKKGAAIEEDIVKVYDCIEENQTVYLITEYMEPEQDFYLAPGTILNKKYRIKRSIGSGGFAITYEAYDKVMAERVAVKEFYPKGYVNRRPGETKVRICTGSKKDDYDLWKEQFLKEARNTRNLSENEDVAKEKDIIKVYDCFEENQTAYMIMEYVDAPLLKDKLKEGKMTEDTACGYMRALLKALVKVHRYGMVHADISPDNIFITGTDSVKLFDFGAARLLGGDSSGDPLGKPGYAPPEQYDRNNQPAVSMDIYAAGAVFYEMLTGKRPIDAQRRLKGERLKKPGEYGVLVSAQIEKTMFRALALRPQDRFLTVQAFQRAIKIKDLKKFAIPAAVVVVAAGMVVASRMISADKSKLDFGNMESERLSVWLCAEEKTGEKLSEMLMESVQKEWEQITVDVRVISGETYTDQLTEAAKKDKLPDVFCTDGIPASEYCTELSDLIDSMELSSYLYLERLKDQEEVYELPTALQIGTVYISREKEEQLPAYFDYASLWEQRERLGFADDPDAFAKFADSRDPVCLIAGDLSDMEKVEEVTIEKIPSADFAALPILKEGKVTGSLINHYGIKKCEDINKNQAGMALLSMLFSDGMQSAYYMNNEEGIPLNKTIFEEYKEMKLNTYLSFVKDYDLQEAELYENTDLCGQIRKEIGGDT